MDPLSNEPQPQVPYPTFIDNGNQRKCQETVVSMPAINSETWGKAAGFSPIFWTLEVGKTLTWNHRARKKY